MSIERAEIAGMNAEAYGMGEDDRLDDVDRSQNPFMRDDQRDCQSWFYGWDNKDTIIQLADYESLKQAILDIAGEIEADND